MLDIKSITLLMYSASHTIHNDVCLQPDGADSWRWLRTLSNLISHRGRGEEEGVKERGGERTGIRSNPYPSLSFSLSVSISPSPSLPLSLFPPPSLSLCMLPFLFRKPEDSLLERSELMYCRYTLCDSFHQSLRSPLANRQQQTGWDYCVRVPQCGRRQNCSPTWRVRGSTQM